MNDKENLSPQLAIQCEQLMTSEALEKARNIHISRAMASYILGVTVKTLYRWDKNGRLPYMYDEFDGIHYTVEYLMDNIYSGRVLNPGTIRTSCIVRLMEYVNRMI